jgi:hypothetical protein
MCMFSLYVKTIKAPFWELLLFKEGVNYTASERDEKVKSRTFIGGIM